MQITEEKLDQIENDLIRFFRHVALPRFMKEIRKAGKEGTFKNHLENHNFVDDFIVWLEAANFPEIFNPARDNGNGN